jgi:hypothetical protein
MFICHVLFVCQLHSTYPLQAFGLQRMVRNQYISDRATVCTCERSARVTSSSAYQIQIQQENWVDGHLRVAKSLESVNNRRKPWDSALATITLLLSCGASLGSCFHLFSSDLPDDVTSWRSPLHVGYIIAPSITTAAGLGATYLHSLWYTCAFDVSQVVAGALKSTYSLLYFILPTSILTKWLIRSGQDVVILSSFQFTVLGTAVLLPLYAFHTGSDDW